MEKSNCSVTKAARAERRIAKRLQDDLWSAIGSLERAGHDFRIDKDGKQAFRLYWHLCSAHDMCERVLARKKARRKL